MKIPLILGTKKLNNTNDKHKQLHTHDEIVDINSAIYTRLKDDIGESTIDTAIHSISGGKEYAGYLVITTDRDDWYKWHEETHTYSQRYFQEDGSFLIEAR